MEPARMFKLVLLVALIAAAVSVQAQTKETATAGKDTALVNIELKDTSVKDAIDTLFEGSGRSYFILPGVTGKVVDLKLKGLAFDEALKALTDAAGLAYRIDDGVYTVGPPEKIASVSPVAVTGTGPAEAKAAPKKETAPAQQPKVAPQEPAPAVAQPSQPAQPSTVVINNQPPSPVYYGQPAPQPYGYGYPQVYRFGNVNVVGGYPPVVVAGANPYVFNYGPKFPPPPGWVSPEVLRFLRGQWAIQQQPYFITPYPY